MSFVKLAYKEIEPNTVIAIHPAKLMYEKWRERVYGAADLSRSFFMAATTCRSPKPTHRASDGHREEGQPSGSNRGCRAPSRNDRNLSAVRPFRPWSDQERRPPSSRVRIRYRADICVHSWAVPVALASLAPALFQAVSNRIGWASRVLIGGTKRFYIHH